MLFFKHSPKNIGEEKPGSQNPKILDVNLVKEEIQVSFDWKKNLSVLAAVIVVAFLLLAEIYAGLNWWEAGEIRNSQKISADLAEVNKGIDLLRAQADTALAYKNKTTLISALLADHVYWSNFFSWLERNTLSDVKYAGFSGGLSGSYTLAATAKNLAEVSWQVKTLLASPLVIKASVDGASVNVDRQEGKASAVNFNLDLQLKPDIFKK